MTEQVRVAITGGSGRMGRTLIEAAKQNDLILLGAAIERAGSTLMGVDAGELAGVGAMNVAITDSLDKAVDDFDVLIDFTSPEASVIHTDWCAKHGKAIVIGTTGFDQAQKEQISANSKKSLL